MHKVRRTSLRAILDSLLSGSLLSITALDRNIDSKTTKKYQIKCSMCLCSNPHLYHEIGDFQDYPQSILRCKMK